MRSKKSLLVAGILITSSIATSAMAENVKGKRFDRLDTNKDGMLSRSEMQAGQAKRLNKLFSTADANGDGVLSKEELKKHWSNKKARKTTSDT
jgi:Ca2+-binding EF-hand superfamily protein